MFSGVTSTSSSSAINSRHCSRERVEKALISIGKDDLQEIYDEGKTEEIVCNFCNKKYEFTHENIGELLNNKK